MTLPIHRSTDPDGRRTSRMDAQRCHVHRGGSPSAHRIGGLSFLALCLPLVWIQPLGAAESETSGTITEVTVYRAGARVVRQLDLQSVEELQQIRVTQLPYHMVRGSVFTQTGPETHLRSLRVIPRRGVLDPDTKQRLNELLEQHKELNRRLEAARQTVGAIEQDLLTVDQLVDFSADKVKQNLDRATLDVQSVTALADFAMQRRRTLGEELLGTQGQIKQLTEEIAENERQQQITGTEHLKTSYEALITVEAPQGGTLRLVYDVEGVSWTPRYSVRSEMDDDANRRFSLRLDAQLVQDSGEPWNNVALTLATSTPDTRAARPLLTPLRVQAVSPGETAAVPDAGSNISSGVGPQWLDQEMMRQSVYLNALANDRQVNELTSAAEVQRKVAEDAGDDIADETYPIDKRISLESHRQVQTISILSNVLAGELHHVVTPLLSSFSFREAELTNTSDRNLIAGNADVYLDGQFVGRTAIPPTAAGQRLTIGFGTDRQIRTRRELLARDQSVHGGNRRSTLKHRLVVSNLYETPMKIRLLDRIPIFAEDGSINVVLDSSSADALSKDELYVRMQRPTGVLRWDLEIPANSSGSDAFDHEYSYTIELDRNQTLVSNDIEQTLGDLRFQKTNMGGGMGGGGMF